MQTERTFEARWGNAILDTGISTVPTLILKHQGELSLTNGEFALVVQAMSFKWSGTDPYVTAAELARRMGCTVKCVRKNAKSLRDKGYLTRTCVDQKQSRWLWDFSGLLAKAMELESTPQGDPGDDGGAPQDEQGGYHGSSTPPYYVSGTEVEQVLEVEHPEPLTTTSVRQGTVQDGSDLGGIVVVEKDSDSTTESKSEPIAEAAGAPEVETVRAVVEELTAAGICERVAKKLARQYGPARVIEVLGALEAQDKQPKNPAGWIRQALTEEWNLDTVRASEASQEASKQESPGQDIDEQVKALGAYVAQLKREHADRYPMDNGNFTAPDTYHAPDVEEYADPATGIEKLKAGLRTRAVA